MTLNRFQKLALATIIATILLILIGGLVRALEAGLGCPDWPKCFGLWIPPTSVADLPPQYDATLFSPYLTWVEYLNRLVGVIIGFLILLTFGFSWSYRKVNRSVPIYATAAFVLVLFQGWLGGQVVKTGLHEGMITIHMLVAMLIVVILLLTIFATFSHTPFLSLTKTQRKEGILLLTFLLIATFIQIILGTQVREEVDAIKNAAVSIPREFWAERLSLLEPIHRTFSWMILALMIYTGFKIYDHGIALSMRWFVLIVTLTAFQILLGFGLIFGAFPALFQILHLTNMSLIVCSQTILLLMYARGQLVRSEMS